MHFDTVGLGRRPELSAELAALGDPNLTAGRVLAHHRGRWLVATPEASAIEASASGASASEASASGASASEASASGASASEASAPEASASEASAAAGPALVPPRPVPGSAVAPQLLPARGRLRDAPPVTGDWVAVDAAGAIAAVLERRGTIVRRDAGDTTAPQVLAANVELVLVVEPLPEPNERRAERLAALASADDVPAALVLTKADLDPDAHLTAARVARRMGHVDAVAVSAQTGDGLGVLRTLLQPGATAVLLGASGAGKSTLVNALLGEQRQATRPVRAGDRRGRHTTVTRELIALPSGALVVDTPGIRKVGLWDGTGSSFADVDDLAAHCRFADCRHEDEPGCAVRDAVDPDRLSSWRKLIREQAWTDDRKAAARERGQLGRQRWAEQRTARRMKGR